MSGKSKKGPRTVRLTIASIDPWSVMKMAFLLSLAIAIAMLVATLVLWLVLQATGVMGNIESTLSEIAGAESADQLLVLVSWGRVMATAFVLALVNIVLMTALSTLFAFLYNIGASIVGGFHSSPSRTTEPVSRRSAGACLGRRAPADFVLRGEVGIVASRFARTYGPIAQAERP